MKLRRIAALPFAFIADAATLGNIGGDRSFTQQIFDAEQREQARLDMVEAVQVLREISRASALGARRHE